jgi:hypothetical protein
MIFSSHHISPQGNFEAQSAGKEWPAWREWWGLIVIALISLVVLVVFVVPIQSCQSPNDASVLTGRA